MEIGVWECTPGSFPSAKDGISEVMQFVSGEATIVGDRDPDAGLKIHAAEPRTPVEAR